MLIEDRIIRLEEKYNINIIKFEEDKLVIKHNKYYYNCELNNISRFNFTLQQMTNESLIRYTRDVLLKEYPYLRILKIDKDYIYFLNIKSNIKYNQIRNQFYGYNTEEIINKIINITTKEEKIKNKIISILGEFYNYDKFEYNGIKNKSIITCPIHGDFEIIIENTLNKKCGCSNCSYEKKEFGKRGFIKYCNNNLGKLYIVKLFNENEEFYKIGITSKYIEERMKQIPYNYEILMIKEDNPELIYDLENSLHKNFKKNKYIPNIKFNGYKECYKDLDINVVKYKYFS